MKRTWIFLIAISWMMTSCVPVPDVNNTLPVEMEVSHTSEPDPVREIVPEVPEPGVDHPMNLTIEPVPTATSAILGVLTPGKVFLVTPSDSMNDMIQLAKSMLANKLGIAPTQITLFDILAVEWPDSSLGCPRPGMMYAEVVTPGYKIQLEVDGSYYAIHSDTINRVVLCSVEPPHEIYHPP